MIRSGGRLRRYLAGVLIIAIAALAGLAVYRLGSFLHRQDALQRADAIFVLAGTRMERALEAADLYRDGWAPRIVLTEEAPDGGLVALQQRGFTFASDAELARDALVQIGVPASAITILPDVHDNTAHEAMSFRRLATSRGWARIIVVTSKFHTRRAGFAVRRELKGSGIEAIVRSTRYDRADPARWWRSRADVRWATSEAQKLIVYALGLGM